MVGAYYSSNATFLYKPFHHYEVHSRDYNRDLRCHYALRLTNAATNSVGQVTYKIKQLVIFGFETDFSVQMLHPSIICESTICVEKYNEGFAFMIHNHGDSVHQFVSATDSKMEGLGYAGLPGGLVVEFDFGWSLNLNDPSYPHVSVQYRADGEALSPHHSYSLAFTHIPPSMLNSEVHNIRIVYRREINEINFRTDNFHVNLTFLSFIVHCIRIIDARF
jgi:hypothetical protein